MRIINNVIDLPTNKHYVYIDKIKYNQQPRGAEMGLITNRAKFDTGSKRVSTTDLLKAFKSGQSIVPCNYELTSGDKLRFISSTLIMIDVDDEKEETDPENVLNELKNICTGLFFTFSHGIKGNRYRLIFQLDKPITNEEDYSAMLLYIAKHINQKGIPADTAVKTPLTPIRTGRKGYLINDINLTIPLNEWLPLARKEFDSEIQRRKKVFETDFNALMNNPPTFEELTDICEAIGHIPSGQDRTEEWLGAVYGIKHCVALGIVSDTEGYELFNIVSGGESNEKQWRSMRADGRANFYSLLKLSEGKGYQRKNNYIQSYLSNKSEGIPTLSMKTERMLDKKGNWKHYIPKDKAIELLQLEERLLIESPTGSGKTTAFMNAFKELSSDEHTYFIFSAPTRVLGEQVAKEHNVPYIKGGMLRKKESIIKNIRHGKRIFVSTYDKTKELITYIKTYHSDRDVKLHLVIDEAHKVIDSYNFRTNVMNELKELSSMVDSYIGLTGTPEDTKKDDYDKMITFNGNNESPCQRYSVIEYEAIKNLGVIESGNQILIKFIQRQVKDKFNLLVYINNIDRAEKIAQSLREGGINTQVINSQKKESSTYNGIVEDGTIESDVQVILTTVVLADGVSINNSLNWLCVVVSDKESQITNPSTIKQISNRFRNDYRYFVLFTRPPQEERQEDIQFNMAAAFYKRMNIARNYIKSLNDEFSNNLTKFVASEIEKDYGIFINESTGEFDFNELQARHYAMREKERYYASYRNALIKEVGRLIGHKEHQLLKFDESTNAFTDSEINKVIELEAGKKLLEKKNRSEQLQNFNEYFDKNVYLAIIHSDDDISLKTFKDNVHECQYHATLKNAHITTFEACKVISFKADKRAKINAYMQRINTLVDTAHFDYVAKNTMTKKIYKTLLTIAGDTYETKEFKDITENKLRKTIRFNKQLPTVKDMKGVVKMFHEESWRKNSTGFKVIKPVTIESVAKEFGISETEVRHSMKMYIQNIVKDKNQQKTYAKAVEEMHGIKVDL